MFLKSLTLKGFKSFADPTTVRFEPGITVVVGPNGSGKSNVVDAVAWVLGAQGPRTVRSQKMEDVIFAGSADRPPLGRAEVSLVVDNTSGRLPGGLAEITITRTLFRSGDSEYALNGQPCRLLDIQELLSDSGVGRSQHVIISQGQLDAVLNARPEDRRAIIEEAAGVLKHRRRRERAERRLAATEENLERLGDLVREVKRQMRPLERQATAARTHGRLAEELRVLRLHLVGRELAALERRVGAATAERTELARESESLSEQRRALEAAVDEESAAIAASRGRDLGASLARAQALAERARGTAAVLRERRRSLELELEAAADVDVVSSLETDAARLEAEIGAADAEVAALAPALADAAAAVDAAGAGGGGGDAVEREALRGAQEACAVAVSRRDVARHGLERDRLELDRHAARLAATTGRHEQLVAEVDRLAAELAAAETVAAELDLGRLGTADDAAVAASSLERAEAEARTADRDRHRLEARAEALAGALEAQLGGGAAEAVEGALGRLGDLVEVPEHWRPALESALAGSGDPLGVVVVEDSGAGRAALDLLERRALPGALVALDLPWTGTVVTDVPPGCVALRTLVLPRLPGVGPLVDRLLGAVVVTEGSWEAALDVALARPDLVVVTQAGDRFSVNGWCLRGGDGVVSASAVEEARRRAATAAEQAERAAAVLVTARRAASAAESSRVEALRAAERAADRVQALSGALDQARAAAATLGEELTGAGVERAALVARIETDEQALARLEADLPALEAAAAAARARMVELGEAARRAEAGREEARRRQHEVERRAAALGERRQLLAGRLADVERRLAGRSEAREQAAARRTRIVAAAAAVEDLSARVAALGERVTAVAAALGARRSAQLVELREKGERLEDLQRRRQEAGDRLESLRQRAQELEVHLAESGARRDAATEALRRELGCEPADALEAPEPVLPEGVTAEQRATQVQSELNAMGPVNPLAVEELSALEERHRFLVDQTDDVRRARRELFDVIHAVDDEITRLFADAFADVNNHFGILVSTLFPGGTGRLSLSEPTDLLNTGVEVEARPAGKQVRKLSLLSGGERSLVALAFLFAVFRSRPSPFYMLDEVEPALDDVNLHRFLDMLHEFRADAQLIIVSHQKRTMEAADALYGVTMGQGGSSKVVSQRVGRRLGPAGPDDGGSSPGPAPGAANGHPQSTLPVSPPPAYQPHQAQRGQPGQPGLHAARPVAYDPPPSPLGAEGPDLSG